MPRKGGKPKEEDPENHHKASASDVCPRKLAIRNVAQGLSVNFQKLNRTVRQHLSSCQNKHKWRSAEKLKGDSTDGLDEQPSASPSSLSLLFQPRVPSGVKVLRHEVPQWWNLWGGQPPGMQPPGWRSHAGTPIQILPPDQRSSKKKRDKFGGIVHGRNAKNGRCLGQEDEGMARVGEDDDVMCVEVTKGRKRVYRRRTAATAEASGVSVGGFWAQEREESGNQRVRNVLRSYLLPQGFPETVAPQYAQYMMWRGVQYFFGGAMAVFTTKSLLSSLGVAGKRSGEAAAAINWVLKDGAGRVGRLLFARWGRALDSELKQFRMGGDMLMELGAAMELSTILVPRFFLPLACTANLSKNLAAVAASSTRAPIYRNFALQNNMADITAKGESVANLADIMGTLMGIVLSKAQVRLLPTFLFLSTGYLFASRKEIDSVELPYLNRARLSLVTDRFLETGAVPGIAEANHCEPLFPWEPHAPGRVILGASVAEAFESSHAFQEAVKQFAGRPYIITYRPSTKKTYVLLHKGSKPLDVMQGSFTAHVFLHLLSGSKRGHWTDSLAFSPFLASLASRRSPSNAASEDGDALDSSSRAERQRIRGCEWKDALKTTREVGEALFGEFKEQALERGWKLQATNLNASETRLVSV